MTARKARAMRVAGAGLLYLVSGVLILAGVLKLVNVGAEDMLEGLEKAGLLQHTTLISVLAIGCGVLLLIPRTTGFGLLASSGYWGGAIVAHLTYDDSPAMPAAFLVLLWIGAALRHGGELFQDASAEGQSV